MPSLVEEMFQLEVYYTVSATCRVCEISCAYKCMKVKQLETDKQLHFISVTGVLDQLMFIQCKCIALV